MYKFKYSMYSMFLQTDIQNCNIFSNIFRYMYLKYNTCLKRIIRLTQKKVKIKMQFLP